MSLTSWFKSEWAYNLFFEGFFFSFFFNFIHFNLYVCSSSVSDWVWRRVFFFAFIWWDLRGIAFNVGSFESWNFLVLIKFSNFLKKKMLWVPFCPKYYSSSRFLCLVLSSTIIIIFTSLFICRNFLDVVSFVSRFCFWKNGFERWR
jgi:hypothetical protein